MATKRRFYHALSPRATPHSQRDPCEARATLDAQTGEARALHSPRDA